MKLKQAIKILQKIDRSEFRSLNKTEVEALRICIDEVIKRVEQALKEGGESSTVVDNS